MTEKNGIFTYECDRDPDGAEILNSSQRNNELVWPSVKEKPKAQYRTSWKNMCNVTSYVMALEYAGWKFPGGPYKQPEDNLGLFILTNKDVRDYFKNRDKHMYDLFMKSLDGKCTDIELEQMYFPTELHNFLSYGANNWIGENVSMFVQNESFVRQLFEQMVCNNLPMVISTNFGGFGHIVTVTGVQYKGRPDIHSIPTGIIVDDPWGKYNPTTNVYDAPNGGNDILIPWDRVVKSVKPYGSADTKWMHLFKHGEATI